MIVIIADLSSLRAFRVVPNENDPTNPQPPPILREIEVSPIPGAGPQPIKEIVTDQAGRFRSDRNPGMSHGDAHGLEQEQEKRNIAELATAIERVIASENPERWSLAAPKAINARLVNRLETTFRERLSENHQADLCKQPVIEIQKRFKLPNVI